MKNVFFSILIVSVALFFSSCGGFSNYDAQSDGLARILNDVKTTIGEDGKIDEITIMFEKEDGKRSIISYFAVDFQSKSDKNKLQRVAYHGHSGWTAVEPLEITVRGNAADFDLDTEVNSISLVTAEVLKKVYDNALAEVGKDCDNIIFSFISAKLDADTDVEYLVNLKGTLKSNGVTDDFFLDFDQNGNLTEKR